MDAKVARGRRIFLKRVVLALLGVLLATDGLLGLTPLFGQLKAPQVPGRQSATRAPLVSGKKIASSCIHGPKNGNNNASQNATQIMSQM